MPKKWARMHRIQGTVVEPKTNVTQIILNLSEFLEHWAGVEEVVLSWSSR